MKKIIRLTESDLTRIVKRLTNEVWKYEDDDDANDEWFNDREEMTTTIMEVLKPYYEKHGLELTVEFIDDLKHLVGDSQEDNPFIYY